MFRTERPSETCRVLLQKNKFERLVYWLVLLWKRVSIVVGYAASLVGSWFLMFQNGVKVSYSMVEMSKKNL